MALSEDDIAEGLMTRHAAAAFMGVSITTIDRMIRYGELEAVRVRGAVRVSRAACVDALNRTSNLGQRRPTRPQSGRGVA